MIYVYASVSTATEGLSNYVAHLKAAVCKGIVGESIRGAITERPQHKRRMAAFTHDMQRADDGLCLLAEPVVDARSEFAELELAKLCVAAKARGVQSGRKYKVAEHHKRRAKEDHQKNETQRTIARNYNVDQSTTLRLS